MHLQCSARVPDIRTHLIAKREQKKISALRDLLRSFQLLVTEGRVGNE